MNSIGENSPIGYILEVDLKYSDELHELHNDYPLAPEKLEISQMLSNYFNNIASKYGRKTCSDNKLVPNLGNKSYSLWKSSVVFIARNEISWCS